MIVSASITRMMYGCDHACKLHIPNGCAYLRHYIATTICGRLGMKKASRTKAAQPLPDPNSLGVGDITVKVERWGVIPTVLDPVIRAVLKEPEVRKQLKGTQH